GEQDADENRHKGEPIVGSHRSASFSTRKARTSATSTSGAMKLAPIPRARMKVSLPRLTFLSWAMSSIRRSAPGRPPGTDETWMGRPTAARWRSTRSASAGDSSPRLAENAKASAIPSAIASPCNRRSEKPAAASSAWPKGWPRLSSARPPPHSAPVPANDRALQAEAPRDGVPARGAACKQLPPIRLQPGEEASIPDQSVFGDFGIARAELACRQRVEQRGVGQDQHRLMERTDEVLALAGIDCGLAADRGIDLRKQRGGDLHIVETAADNRSGKAGKIADDAATERHHDIGALDARGNQRFADSLEHREALRSLARWYRHRRGADAGGSKRGLGRREMM